MGVKRVNITLPEDVVQILSQRAKSGEKSSYIAEAVRSYAKKQSKASLVSDMIKGYQATAKEDLDEDGAWSSTHDDGDESE